MQPPSRATAEVVNIKTLVRLQHELNARRAAEFNAKSAIPADPLDLAINDWWSSLPVVTRHRRYQLSEISDALHIRTGHRFADRHITAILEAKGWTQHRDWTRAGRNRRYWKPETTTKGALL